MKKSIIFGALATAGMIAAPSANAALATDASLLMGPQTGFCSYGLGTYPDSCTVSAIPDGNYFAMDSDGSGVWEDAERVGIEAGTDGGIVLGASQAPGAIDNMWGFFGQDGWHTQLGTLSVASDDGAGNAEIDMSGWTVFWNGVNIDMGGSTTTTPSWPDTGIATVSCGNTCEAGDTFVLDYSAHVPDDGSTNFGNVAYALHLTGTIGSAVIPVPAAVWLFGSGLLGLVGVARRRKAA